MSIAYFDCFAGVSGDMILGALIDLGLSKDELESKLMTLGLSSFSISSEVVSRKGIRAVNVSVKTDEDHHHRKLPDILKILDSPELSDAVKEKTCRIFTRIAEAEGKIHQMPVEEIHFHEVGAMDSIIDIIGSIWGMEKLGITDCFSSAISLGSGSVKCAHGTISVPSPATLELVKDFPVIKKEVGKELATPTGVALITTVAKYTEQLAPMRIEKTGYGCGDRELEDFANVLRIIIGQSIDHVDQDVVMVLETNIDDVTGELYPHLVDKIFETGAVDVYITPIIMKKGRPGHTLTVLTARENLDKCLEILFRESTTLGIRMYETFRHKLKRSSESLETPWGRVKVKAVQQNGKKRIVPEYEECKKIADKENIPLLDVYDKIKNLGNPDDQM